MTSNCPYCDEPKKNVPNHIRLTSGNGHGERGAVPDSFDAEADAGESDSEPEDPEGTSAEDADDGDSMADRETAEVTPDDLTEPEDTEETEDSDDGDDLPFDPDDGDAIRLDGGETMDVRKDGKIYQSVTANEGDWLLQTDKGPVLYDAERDELFEILTV